MAYTQLLNWLRVLYAILTASSAALSDWGDPSIATSIFFLRLSIVTAFSHLGCPIRKPTLHLSSYQIVKYFFRLDNYKTIFYASALNVQLRARFSKTEKYPFIQPC